MGHACCHILILWDLVIRLESHHQSLTILTHYYPVTVRQWLALIQIFIMYHKHFCVTYWCCHGLTWSPLVGWLVGWFAGAGAAPSHPWSGSSLCGKLRPPQRRADVRVRQTRAAVRAAECSASRKGLRCRNESAAKIFQRSLSTAVSPQLSVNTHTKPVLVINRCSLLNS